MPGLVPPVTTEREGLMSYLAHQREVLTYSAYGLTEEEARMHPTASGFSVGGIIKHVAQTERFWIAVAADRYSAMSQEEGFKAYTDGLSLTANETLEEILESYKQAGQETEEVVAGIADLSREFPVPDAPWFPKDVKTWSVRWVLLHLIEETARHAGHADIIREAIDGATALPLMAAAESWPESPWVKPWKRKT